MRILGTVLVGLLFAVAFAAFFLFQSVSRYPMATDEVVGTLRAADVRTATLDTLETVVRREVRNQPADPVFAEFVLSQARSIIEQVITEEWFYDTVAQAHRGLVDFLERGMDSVRIDLAGIKDQLRNLLWEVGRHGTEMCDAVGGGRMCYDAARDLNGTLRRYRGQVDQAMSQVPDQVNLTWLLTMGGAQPGELEQSEGVQQIRELLARLRTVRWIGLAALVVLLALIVTINLRSLQRMLVNAGAVLAASAALYLAVIPALGDAVAERVNERLGEDRTATARGAPASVDAAAQRVAVEVFARIARRSDSAVVVVLGSGLALLAGGIVLHMVRRRRLRPEPHTLPPPPPYAGPMPPGYYPPPAQ